MLRLPVLLVVMVVVVTTMALPQFGYHPGLRSGAKNPAGGGRRGLCNPACPRIYLPVCGSDGKTYPNNCALNYYSCAFANVTFSYLGQCVDRGGREQKPCPVICPYLYAPVCGSDGNTYPNTCTLDATTCKNPSITLQYGGKCDSPDRRPPCPSSCPGSYDPVCGSDANTYGNQCTLDLVSCRDSSVTLVSSGECGAPFNSCPDVCSEERQAVCGSDGLTYMNECVFQAATCRHPTTTFTSTAGECASQRPCRVLCPAQYLPVCGSNGRTYPNQCVLEIEACDDPSLTTDTTGECPKTPSKPPTPSFTTTTTTTTTTRPPPTFTLLPPRLFCPNTCRGQFRPVCGSDGRTYYNRCLLMMMACRERRRLTIAYLGMCV